MKNKTLIFSAHVFFWICYLAIHTWVFSHFLNIQTSFFRGCVNAIPLMMLSYVNIWAITQFFEKRKYVLYVLVAILVMILIGTIRFYVNELFPSFRTDFGFVKQKESLLIGILLTNVLFLIFSAFYQILVNRFAKTKRQAIELQVHQEAQLQYLRSQINPHFLFNTLNNIYALATMKSDKTAPMVLKLSHLLRYIVYQEDEKKVLLKKELQLITDYIDLYKLKSENELNISMQIEGHVESQSIEPLILIPIVENCFKHSDLETNPKAYIHIEINVNSTTFEFKAINTKDNNLKQKDDVGGVGLSNIKIRLNILNPEHFISIEEKDEMFIVHLKLKLAD